MKPRAQLGLVVTLALLGCSAGAPTDAGPAVDAGAPTDAGPPVDAGEDAGTDAGVSCEGLSEPQCTASGCRAIFGWRSVDAGVRSSNLARTYAGCHQWSSPGALDCMTAFSCGRPRGADGECWLFSDTCQPTGWFRLECAQVPLCPSLP